MESTSNANIKVNNNQSNSDAVKNLNWYSLRVISGKEKAVEQNILYESKIVEIRNSKKIIKEKMFFPGYILIKMSLNKKTKYIIENINGVMSFVGPKGKSPVPLRDDEIKRIFGEVERKEGRELMVTPFKKGDYCKVIAGPFIDFSGTVDEVNDDKQKVKLVISIFGRLTPVELDYFQVEVER